MTNEMNAIDPLVDLEIEIRKLADLETLASAIALATDATEPEFRAALRIFHNEIGRIQDGLNAAVDRLHYERPRLKKGLDTVDPAGTTY